MQRKTVPIAGWLFADLLLGLAMLFITSMVGVQMVTSSPTVSPSATSSLTPTLTSTLTPTIAAPRGTPSATPVPPTSTPLSGLNPTPFVVTLRLNPVLVPGLVSASDSDKKRALDQLRDQIKSCFSQVDQSAKGAMVLSFGKNPKDENGNKLAVEVNNLLPTVYPTMFANAARRDFHTTDGDPTHNGNVRMEIYYLRGFGASDPKVSTCFPEPTWCSGDSSPDSVLLNIVNWVAPTGNLTFRIDNRERVTVPFAAGDGNNPLYHCVQLAPGSHTWNADYGGRPDSQTIYIQKGVEPPLLSFCLDSVSGSLRHDGCRGPTPRPPLSGDMATPNPSK